MMKGSLEAAAWPKNLDVRSQMYYRVNGLSRAIPLWIVAEEISIHENTLRIWLRKEMTPERREKVIDAISKVRRELEDHGVSSIGKDSSPAV